MTRLVPRGGWWAALAAFVGLLATAVAVRLRPGPAADPPPGPAATIAGVRRLDDTIIRRTTFSGDNWHTTWGADGHQYVLVCDDRIDYNTRLWRLVGDPPDFTFEPVTTHPGPPDPDIVARKTGRPRSGQARYYGFGILAVGDTISHFLSTPDRWSGSPKFVGAKFISSPDGGRTWRNQDGTTPVVFEDWGKRDQTNMTFWNEPDKAFSLLSILQMGKGYAQNRDGYAYVYTPNGSTEGRMNQLVLFRAPKGRLGDRAAYEYFAGLGPDGGATWSAAMADHKPVHTFPAGWVNTGWHPYAWHPSVVYDAPLGVYLMANWGMGTDPKTGKWFAKPSYLGLYAADHPWGPWRQVHEDTAWFPPGGTAKGQCYQPQILPGWIAPDGKSFWLAWTQFPEGYYFQCQKVEVVVK